MGAEQELRVRDDDAVRVGVQPLPGYESDSPKGDFYVTFPFESLMRLDRVCVQGLHSIKKKNLTRHCPSILTTWFASVECGVYYIKLP